MSHLVGCWLPNMNLLLVVVAGKSLQGSKHSHAVCFLEGCAGRQRWLFIRQEHPLSVFNLDCGRGATQQVLQGTFGCLLQSRICASITRHCLLVQVFQTGNGACYSRQVKRHLLAQFTFFAQANTTLWLKILVVTCATFGNRLAGAGFNPVRVLPVCPAFLATFACNLNDGIPCFVKRLFPSTVLVPLGTNLGLDAALEFFRKQTANGFPSDGLHLTGLNAPRFGCFTIGVCNDAVSSPDTQHGRLTSPAKVFNNRRISSGQCLKQSSSHRMGVNRHMVNVRIWSGDVVVEGANLVFSPQLFADVLPTAIPENADCLFNRSVG